MAFFFYQTAFLVCDIRLQDTLIWNLQVKKGRMELDLGIRGFSFSQRVMGL